MHVLITPPSADQNHVPEPRFYIYISLVSPPPPPAPQFCLRIGGAQAVFPTRVAATQSNMKLKNRALCDTDSVLHSSYENPRPVHNVSFQRQKQVALEDSKLVLGFLGPVTSGQIRHSQLLCTGSKYSHHKRVKLKDMKKNVKLAQR